VITEKNRSLCTELGAANHYKLEHLKRPEIWNLVESAHIFFVGGYHLTVCPEAALALAKEAATKNKVEDFLFCSHKLHARMTDRLNRYS
jgi:adenosine kinase